MTCPKCQSEFETFEVCAQCGSDEVGEVGMGDEGWTHCEACRSVEGGYKEITVCPNCYSYGVL